MGKASRRKLFRKQIASEAFAWMCGEVCLYLKKDGCRLSSHPNECSWGVVNQSLTKDWQKTLEKYVVHHG